MKLKFIPIMTLVATMLLSSTVFGATGKVINGRTMIPLRGAFEELGFSVSWDSATNSATLKDSNHNIVVTQNSTSYTVDGTKYTSDVAPQVISGSMYIPLRTLGDKIGATTGWDDASQTATIKYNGKTSTITTNSGSNTSKSNTNTTSNDLITKYKIQSAIVDTADVISMILEMTTTGMNYATTNPTLSVQCLTLAKTSCVELRNLDYSYISPELEATLNSYATNTISQCDSLVLSIQYLNSNNYTEALAAVKNAESFGNAAINDITTFQKLTAQYFD